MFSGSHLGEPFKRHLKKIREKLVQENQQLYFKIKPPIKIANQELGQFLFPYFLHTQTHPGKQKPSLLEAMMQTKCGAMLKKWAQLVAWQVCGMVEILRVI